MMEKPNSAAQDAEIAAAAKYAQDQRLAQKLARKAYGDGLDRLSLREGMSDQVGVVLLVIAFAMYGFGELVFAWQSGDVMLPSLKAGDMHFGGVVSVANSLIFLLLVFLFIADGRPFFGRKGRRNQVTGEVIEPATPGNRWGLAMGASCLLAVFAIYTAQTTAADEVRQAVEAREDLEDEIKLIEAEIRDALIPNRRTAQLALERAQDEAVGSGLATLTDGEVKILCADVEGFEERMTCRQKLLRASVDCTRDVSTLVRDAACDPIKFAQIQLARIDEEEAKQAARQQLLAEKQDELKAMPEASNKFVRDVASLTSWSIPDAQSRIYIVIALFCLLVPASIFAKVLVRREDPPPAQAIGG